VFEKIKIFDFGTVAIAGIILFFLVFLGWIIAGQILRPLLFPTMKEALDPAHDKSYRLVPTLLCLAVIYGPFVAGFWWAWRKPALFMIEPDGEWVIRNFLYVPLLRVPAGQPRQLEGCFHREYYEDSERDYYASGEVHVLLPSLPGIAIRATCDELPDGRPDFFEKFGYATDTQFLSGPHEGLMTPMHTWGASGPVLLAEQPVAGPSSTAP